MLHFNVSRWLNSKSWSCLFWICFVFFCTKQLSVDKCVCVLWHTALYDHTNINITDRSYTPCQPYAATKRDCGIVGRQHGAGSVSFSKTRHHLTTARKEVLTPTKKRGKEKWPQKTSQWKRELCDQHDINESYEFKLSVLQFNTLLI